MSRRSRSTSAKAVYAAKFPVRVVVVAPGNGLGKRMDDANAWLTARLPGRHGVYGATFFFLGVDDARLFVGAFPDFELGEGTHVEVWQAAAS